MARISRKKGIKNKAILLAVAEGTIGGKTQGVMARESNVSVSTVAEVQHSPECEKLVDELLADRRRRTTMQMEVMSSLALKVHVDLMQDVAHRDRLGAAESVLDRVGLGRSSKVQQTSTVTQTTTVVDDFRGRSAEDLEHYALHGRFP